MSAARSRAAAGPHDGLGEPVAQAAFGGFFDVLPHALRDQALRVPIARLYEWYRDVNVQCVGGDEAGANSGEAGALAGVLVAVVDGLVIQMSLDPDFDPGPSFAIVERMTAAFLGCAQ